MLQFFAGAVTPASKAVTLTPARSTTDSTDASIVVTLTIDGRLAGTITL